jgi:hypothetical protein
MRLLRASLRKLVHRPATLRTFLLLVGLLTLIYMALGLTASATTDPSSRDSMASMLAFPDAHAELAVMLLIFGGFTGAAYAGTVAGSEWTWNTFRVAVARGESRVRYVVGLFVAIAILALLAWVVLYALGVALIVVAATIGRIPTGAALDTANLGRLAILVAGGGWAVLMEVAIGFAAAFIARSQVAGVAAVVGLFFVERFAELVLPADVLRLAPITAATSVVTVAGKSGLDAALIGPLAVTTLYLVAAMVLGSLVARRSQVA